MLGLYFDGLQVEHTREASRPVPNYGPEPVVDASNALPVWSWEQLQRLAATRGDSVYVLMGFGSGSGAWRRPPPEDHFCGHEHMAEAFGFMLHQVDGEVNSDSESE